MRELLMKKGYSLVNLGQFEDEMPLKSLRILRFWSGKMQKQKTKRALCADTARNMYLKWALKTSNYDNILTF